MRQKRTPQHLEPPHTADQPKRPIDMERPRFLSTTTPVASKRMAVSSLLSPPEAVMQHSFTPAKPQVDPLTAPGIAPLPSPPVSPADVINHSTAQAYPRYNAIAISSVPDPQLYAFHTVDSALPEDAPLFPVTDALGSVIDHAIDSHIAGTPKTVKSRPTHREYRLFCNFTSIVCQEYNKNPRLWIEREMAIIERHRASLRGPSNRVDKAERYKPIAPAPMSTRKAPKPSATAAASADRPARQRVNKRTPKSAALDAFDGSAKTPRAPANREDIDYDSLPDHSPPIEKMNLGKNAFKTDWKGQALDLSNDPDVHLLHEQEVTLAATLRLSAATYLCSKRRIFEARIQTLKRGKEFRKTDAQQACKIDVNKASKLWTVFEKNGMFAKQHFQDTV